MEKDEMVKMFSGIALLGLLMNPNNTVRTEAEAVTQAEHALAVGKHMAEKLDKK